MLITVRRVTGKCVVVDVKKTDTVAVLKLQASMEPVFTKRPVINRD